MRLQLYRKLHCVLWCYQESLSRYQNHLQLRWILSSTRPPSWLLWLSRKIFYLDRNCNRCLVFSLPPEKSVSFLSQIYTSASNLFSMYHQFDRTSRKGPKVR